MDVSAIPPARAPMAEPALSPAAQVPRAAVSTAPETRRPVVATAKGETPDQASEQPVAPPKIPGMDFAPLETSFVGDNDDIPVPPEPREPRRPLEMIAAEAAELPAAPEAEADGLAAEAVDAATSEAELPGSKGADDTQPEAASQAAATLETAVRTLEQGPANPTVDLRR